MEKCCLLSLPIYKLSENKLQKTLDKKQAKAKREKLICNTEEKSEKLSKNQFLPYRIWKYNYISGYVDCIITNQNDISFVLYYISDKNNCPRSIRLLSNTKKYYKMCDVQGYHPDLLKWKDNIQIAEEIKSCIEEIVKNYFPGNFYIDYKAFNYIYNKIDYLKIFEEVCDNE